MKCDKRSVRRYSLLLFSCLPYNSEILFDPFSVFSLILICKTLVTPSGVATATARRCYFSQSAVRSHRILICSRRWRCHGVLTPFPRRSHDVSTKFHGVLVGDCLRSTARSRRSHCVDGVLFEFGGSWNNWYGPLIAAQAWAHDNDHAPTVSFRSVILEPKGYCAYIFVSEWYPQHLYHPASAEPAYGKAVAPLPQRLYHPASAEPAYRQAVAPLPQRLYHPASAEPAYRQAVAPLYGAHQ